MKLCKYSCRIRHHCKKHSSVENRTKKRSSSLTFDRPSSIELKQPKSRKERKLRKIQESKFYSIGSRNHRFLRVENPQVVICLWYVTVANVIHYLLCKVAFWPQNGLKQAIWYACDIGFFNNHRSKQSSAFGCFSPYIHPFGIKNVLWHAISSRFALYEVERSK